MMNLPAADDDAMPPGPEDDDDEGNEPFPQDFPDNFAPAAQGEPEEYGDMATPEEDVTEAAPGVQRRTMKKRKRGPQLSQFGVEYPPLPSAVVKRLAQTFAQTSGISKTKITPDTLDALCQASDWFFEQLGDSLRAYAQHAGRKTVDESDVVTLMQRLVVTIVPGAAVRIVRELIIWSNIVTFIQAEADWRLHDPVLARAATPTAGAAPAHQDARSRASQEATEGRRRRRGELMHRFPPTTSSYSAVPDVLCRMPASSLPCTA